MAFRLRGPRSQMKARILIIDDDRALGEMLAMSLKHAGHEPLFIDTPLKALEVLSTEEFSVVITDLAMEGMDGIQLCREILERKPDVPVVVMTAFGSLDTAVSAIRAGAYDFISKPIELEQLNIVVERASKYCELDRELKTLRNVAAAPDMHMVGSSLQIEQVREMVRRVADTEASVLITGD